MIKNLVDCGFCTVTINCSYKNEILTGHPIENYIIRGYKYNKDKHN